MKLVIVESPTKAKTISKFLGADYVVKASFGHVRDLPKSKMGVDTKNNFTPTYTIPTKALEVIAELKRDAKKADEIILATDEDREGEAISWHLIEALELTTAQRKKVSRIVFHEITKDAILNALSHPRTLDTNLVDAQQARRVLDRLVGYELSPFIWRKVRYGLSAGRVQSVAVRLIVEREREIDNFKAEEYWTIEAELSKKNDDFKFTAKLHSLDGKLLGKFGITNKADADRTVSALQTAKYAVSEITKKTVSRNPSPPFTTSTLQQESARKLGYSAKQTMALAQGLYEKGFITYMRTDSVNLAASALTECAQVIEKTFGKEYTLKEPRRFSTKSKGAQEAHEAIRPTSLTLSPDQLKSSVDRSAVRLYELIWKRTLACQMTPASLEATSVDIEAAHASFRATGQTVIFPGFLKIYREDLDESDEKQDDDGDLPRLEKGEQLTKHELDALQHFTEPPPRYTDASLIKALEQNGIGRPSTYAPTLTTIQEREYVTKEEKKFKPTEIGTLVNDLLVENFPEIVDLDFTSHIEEEFDSIAEGTLEWIPVIREFYEPFKVHLKEKEETVAKQVEISETPCPHCGKFMIIKFGRAGKFLACPDPESKITQPMPEEAAEIARLTEKTKGEVCPVCGKPMEVKRGRFGYFLGCVDYPKCKGISKIYNKTGFKCPHCLEKNQENPEWKVGDLVEKKTRGRGQKIFYACTRWPDCEFICNVKPETEGDLAKLLLEWKTKPKDTDKKKAYSRTAKKTVTKKTARKSKAA